VCGRDLRDWRGVDPVASPDRYGSAGARVQKRLPDVLIRRLVGVLVVAIGARYVLSGLS
jgi:hypothetical protein